MFGLISQLVSPKAQLPVSTSKRILGGSEQDEFFLNKTLHLKTRLLVPALSL